jgi:Cyclopropane fatty acid synthase and related methyltransferases
MAQIYDIKEDLTLADSCLCFITPNSTVLEIGSATGYATRFMSEKYNCKVTCIEKIPEMAEMGRKYAQQMIIADLESDNWDLEITGLFDHIIFADVLEHLHNPDKVLAKALKFLKHDGCVITSIPNIGHNAIIMELRNGKFNYTETGLLDNTHIHFMTRQSIYNIFHSNHLHCVAEENKHIRPCDTELGCYYIQNPLMALSLIRKRDGHVYRFVQKWIKTPAPQCSKNKLGDKLSIGKQLFELLYDIACFIKRKLNINTPGIITRLVHKPIEKNEKKRYERYESKS